MITIICSRCGGINGRKNQRYCGDCHNAQMREWRKGVALTPLQRKKDNARSYANVYKRRGHIKRQPCKVKYCLEESEMHHPDYAKPLGVEWICRRHHLELHQQESAEALAAIALIVRKHLSEV